MFHVDPNAVCDIGPGNWDRWAVIPLVSENLGGAVYNLSQIAEAANSKLGGETTASGQINGASLNNTCAGVSECGLLVTPQYVHITGTRTFGPSCNAPQASEQYQISLPKQDNSISLSADVETKPCYKGAAPTAQTTIKDACLSTEPWTEQIVPFEGGIAGPFAKLIGKQPHGSGYRYRVRFNSDNPAFGVRGQALLAALNKGVFEAGAGTAHAHNWQEGPDGFSDVAEFDFDAPDGTSLDNTCRHVAAAVESVSKIGSAGKGVCYS
ncbi:MAG: hypothetical protein L6R38_003642 [Xanthoria sp. 2 TBL-2021]|nr:MAG: hypothetical protein L6R38_003642 [Xanthoria sp. 2 TBL-2021]